MAFASSTQESQMPPLNASQMQEQLRPLISILFATNKHLRDTVPGFDLNAMFERSKRTINKVDVVLKSGKNMDQVDWHRLVINQPCPFLSEEGACEVYEDRPLDCRMVVAFRGICESKKLEHAQRGVVIEEAVG